MVRLTIRPQATAQMRSTRPNGLASFFFFFLFEETQYRDADVHILLWWSSPDHFTPHVPTELFLGHHLLKDGYLTNNFNKLYFLFPANSLDLSFICNLYFSPKNWQNFSNFIAKAWVQEREHFSSVVWSCGSLGHIQGSSPQTPRQWLQQRLPKQHDAHIVPKGDGRHAQQAAEAFDVVLHLPVNTLVVLADLTVTWCRYTNEQDGARVA